MGTTPHYLDPNSHEALFEVDVGVADRIDQSQTMPDEDDQVALARWSDSKSKLAQKDKAGAWNTTVPR